MDGPGAFISLIERFADCYKNKAVQRILMSSLAHAVCGDVRPELPVLYPVWATCKLYTGNRHTDIVVKMGYKLSMLQGTEPKVQFFVVLLFGSTVHTEFLADSATELIQSLSGLDKLRDAPWVAPVEGQYAVCLFGDRSYNCGQGWPYCVINNQLSTKEHLDLYLSFRALLAAFSIVI
jgi:hypothetical protein